MTLPWHSAQFETVLARRERLPHAMLIRGPQGIGKLSFAMALAQALLCEGPVRKGKGCGACPACAWVDQRRHPDLRLLEPEEPEPAGHAERRGAA